MKTRSKLLATHLVMAIVACSAIISSKNAWAKCFGAECENSDPIVSNCYKDAFVLDTGDILDSNAIDGDDSEVFGTVELHYSPECNAKWVHVNYWGPMYRVFTMMNAEGGPYALGMNDGPRKFFSKMTNGIRKVRACTMISFHYYVSNDLGGCTDYH